jgi:hypothetical protein
MMTRTSIKMNTLSHYPLPRQQSCHGVPQTWCGLKHGFLSSVMTPAAFLQSRKVEERQPGPSEHEATIEGQKRLSHTT